MREVSEFLKTQELLLVHETVRQVSLALSCISNKVVICEQNGETRPQEAYENVLAVLNDATSKESINNYVSGLEVCVHRDMAEMVKTASFISLACCLECKLKLSENDSTMALVAALDAREYAGQAMTMAFLTQPLVNRAGEIIRTMEGRAHVQKRDDRKKKAQFIDWATTHIIDGARPRNVHEIKRLDGFDKTLRVIDDTIKRWWREIPGAPALQSGASATK